MSEWSGFLPVERTNGGGTDSGCDCANANPFCRTAAVVDYRDEMVQNAMIGGNDGMQGYAEEIDAGLISGNNAGVYDMHSLYDSNPGLSNDDPDNLVRSIPSQDLLDLNGVSVNTNSGLSFSDIGAVNAAYDETFILDNLVASHINVNRLNVFPSLDEHDQGGLNYSIRIQPTAPGGKNCWYFSSPLSKVYIKMDQTIYVQIQHIKTPYEIVVRLMMVCQDDVGLPVKRCMNHKGAQDSPTPNMCHQNDEAFIDSVIRCENSHAQYLGHADGKNINDRLSVLIPLSSTTADENNMVKQTIALKFVCQNSCIGRRPTAVIFTLEKKNGEVLGKKYLSVKICSCPKRDKVKDESKCGTDLKRTAEEANLPPAGKKIAKIAKIKEEPKDTPPNTPSSDIQIISDDGIRLELNVPDKEFAKQMLDFAFAQMAKRVAMNPDNQTYKRYLEEYKSLYIASITKSENTDV